MTPGIADHVLAAILGVLLPLWGIFEQRRLSSRILRGDARARTATYRLTFGLEWGLAFAVTFAWKASGRSLAGLHLGVPDGPYFGIGLALTGLACAFLIGQMSWALGREESLDEIRREVEPLRDFLPHDEAEGRLFSALAITAGICEEILYRGFLVAWLQAYLPLAAALVVAALVFGLAHAYQGPSGIAKTTGVALVMSGLVVLTGSLVPAMLVHAVMDLTSGILARHVLEEEGPWV
ncbi:MAG: CPBP family intramembrane metalloprotease [Gemmatimonadetes bacterium]|nr:CPBP family intramembrane metalloprotease [Gemmatimonadota bacterium]